MDWIAVKIGSDDGIFRVRVEEDNFTACLWNFKTMYVERVTTEEVLKRAKVRRIFRKICSFVNFFISRNATAAQNTK